MRRRRFAGPARHAGWRSARPASRVADSLPGSAGGGAFAPGVSGRFFAGRRVGRSVAARRRCSRGRNNRFRACRHGRRWPHSVQRRSARGRAAGRLFRSGRRRGSASCPGRADRGNPAPGCVGLGMKRKIARWGSVLATISASVAPRMANSGRGAGSVVGGGDGGAAGRRRRQFPPAAPPLRRRRGPWRAVASGVVVPPADPERAGRPGRGSCRRFGRSARASRTGAFNRLLCQAPRLMTWTRRLRGSGVCGGVATSRSDSPTPTVSSRFGVTLNLLSR